MTAAREAHMNVFYQIVLEKLDYALNKKNLGLISQ